MSRPRFERWASEQLELSAQQVDALLIIPILEVFLSRIEAARRAGASDPLLTVSSKRAGGNSRACTRRMLEQLGLTAPQRRAAHRLFAGAPCGWPGLLHLYANGLDLGPAQRPYIRRQLGLLRGEDGQVTGF